MRIGIDIDNTLCKTFYMTEKIYNKYHDGDFKNLGKIMQYEFSAEYEKDIFDNCPLFDNAVDVINKLYENNDIFFITARCDRRINNIEKRTKDYLKRNNVSYNDIYFGFDYKLDKYKELKLDIMIDDDVSVYESIVNDNGKCILFNSYLNKDCEYNKAYDWNEVYESIIKED